MSYQCKLQVQSFHQVNKKWVLEGEEQMSPLRFETQKECARFANKMFNPPETVTAYELISTDKQANATMKNGVVRMS
jgi:hypothetical protein